MKIELYRSNHKQSNCLYAKSYSRSWRFQTHPERNGYVEGKLCPLPLPKKRVRVSPNDIQISDKLEYQMDRLFKRSYSLV